MESLVSALQIKFPAEVIGGERITQQMLATQAPRVRRLMDLQPSLSFKSSSFQAALKHIAEKASSFRMSDTDAAAFVTEGSARLMRLCRKVAQARSRQTPPMWYKTLFEQPVLETTKKTRIFPKGSGGGGGGSSAASSARVASTQSTFVFGYDQEQDAVWRCKYETPMDKEYTRDFAPGSLDHDPVVATFKDGTKYSVPELSTAAFNERTLASSLSKANPRAHRYFEKTTIDGLEVFVRDRKDRSDEGLISLFVDGAQKCQIDLGMKGAPPTDRAIEMMVVIAQTLCDGKVEIEGLYNLRDKMLAEHGFGKTSKAGKVRVADDGRAGASDVVEVCDGDEDGETDAKQSDDEDGADTLVAARKRPATTQQRTLPSNKNMYVLHLLQSKLSTAKTATKSRVWLPLPAHVAAKMWSMGRRCRSWSSTLAESGHVVRSRSRFERDQLSSKNACMLTA